MNDGSLHFADLPESAGRAELREHIAKLTGASVTGFLTDHITEVWIDFTYHGHRFTINNQFGDYWFFVEAVDCPEEILAEVVSHCAVLLRKAETSR